MATKFFEKVLMASETIQSYQRTVQYLVGATPTAIDDGAFVISNGMYENSVYASYVSGTKDISGLNVVYPASATPIAGTVYVLDIVKVSDGTINGNTYRIGAKTLGLSAVAGEKVAARRLSIDDVFIVGDGNFASAPTVGQYGILAASATTLAPNSTLPSAGFTVKIEQAITKSQGITANVSGYLCRVVQL